MEIMSIGGLFDICGDEPSHFSVIMFVCRRRWVDKIRMDLQEVGCGYMDWIGLTQDRDRWRTLVGAVMNLRVR
jgi:hypothetical protein